MRTNTDPVINITAEFVQ